VQIGDTVHIADPVDGGELAVVQVAPPSVSALLATSRAAHQRFQKASGHNDGRNISHPDDDAAMVAILEAMNARLDAEAADPNHLDPAWSDDQATMRGISSKALLDFYRDYVSTP